MGLVEFAKLRDTSKTMSEPKEFAFENPNVLDEDQETLAAIDEGIRDAEAGRTVSTEEVRKLLPQWITAARK